MMDEIGLRGRTGVDSTHSGLGARIRTLAEILGGKKEMARVANVSEVQIYRYINEENTPSVNIVVTLAQAAGVSIEWLATGTGPKAPLPAREHAGDTRSHRVDVPLLSGVLRIIDRVAAERGHHLGATERANLAARMYNGVCDASGDVEARLNMAESVLGGFIDMFQGRVG
ncbi:MAG: helix-turn-helix transcriptional regulator [Gammaproteobacteria bacterium]|nr:helix-turn-helix transcriptional regulator [Gammaproteobacteria bacterium]